eukprot:gene6599-10762_t
MTTRLVDYFAVLGVGDNFNPIHNLYSKGVSYKTVCFQPYLLDRYPFTDYKESPLPANELHMFCLPNNVQIQENGDLPSFFIFTLTGPDGQRTYGSCLTFSEILIERELMEESLNKIQKIPKKEDVLKFKKKSQSTSNSPTFDLTNEKTIIKDSERIKISLSENSNSIKIEIIPPKKKKPLYITKAFCILSHWPMYSIFKLFLSEIYRISLSISEVPIERHIQNFVEGIPLPPQGKITVEATIGSTVIQISRPPVNKLPLCDVPFDLLFEHLSVDSMIFLINAMLLEKKIVVHSKNHMILGYIIEALSSLIFPFYWQHVYIPLLPKQCKDFIYAPVPFIMGIDTELFQQIGFESSLHDDTVVVDLNLKKVQKIKLEPLPDTKNLKKQLSNILSKYKFVDSINEIDMAFPLVPIPSEIDTLDDQTKEFPKEEIRYEFFRYFSLLFKDYRKYILKAAHGATIDDLSEVFPKRDEYLSNFPKKDQEFFKNFFETSSWERFVIDKIESSTATESLLFDEFIKQQTTKEKVAYLETNEFEIQKKVVIKPPKKSDLPIYSEYQYQSFPKLNPKMLQKLDIPEPLISKDEVSHVRNTVLSSWTTILATLSALGSDDKNSEFKRKVSEADNKLLSVVKESIEKKRLTHKRTISINDQIVEIGSGGTKGFAGTSLYIETMDDDLVDLFSRIVIDTNHKCENCSLMLTINDIHNGWSTNANDYRTTCPRCDVKFVASFTIIIHGEENEIIEKTDYYHLSHAILTKEITNLLKKDVTADVSLFQYHPIIFWNIIIHFQDLKVPLNFVLPRVDWRYVVTTVTHPKNKKTEARKLRISLPSKRKSLPESPISSPKSADIQYLPRELSSVPQKNTRSTPNLNEKKNEKRKSTDTPKKNSCPIIEMFTQKRKVDEIQTPKQKNKKKIKTGCEEKTSRILEFEQVKPLSLPSEKEELPKIPKKEQIVQKRILDDDMSQDEETSIEKPPKFFEQSSNEAKKTSIVDLTADSPLKITSNLSTMERKTLDDINALLKSIIPSEYQKSSLFEKNHRKLLMDLSEILKSDDVFLITKSIFVQVRTIMESCIRKLLKTKKNYMVGEGIKQLEKSGILQKSSVIYPEFKFLQNICNNHLHLRDGHDNLTIELVFSLVIHLISISKYSFSL